MSSSSPPHSPTRDDDTEPPAAQRPAKRHRSSKKKTSNSSDEEAKRRLFTESTPEAKAPSAFERYRGLARAIRRLPADDLMTIQRFTPLKELKVGSVIVSQKFEEKPSAFGRMIVVHGESDNNQKSTSVIIPERFVTQEMLTEKGKYRVLVYLGMSASKKNPSHSCHLLYQHGVTHAIEAHARVEASLLRSFDLENLKRQFETRSLKEFSPNTVFVYSSVRHAKITTSRGEETALVVHFERELESGGTETGEVFIPARYADTLEHHPEGVLLYRGVKPHKSDPSKSYFDVCFPSTETDDVEKALRTCYD